MATKAPFFRGALLCLALSGCAGHPKEAKEPAVTRSDAAIAVKAGHAPVNGISMYYEVHGSAEGPPLVLLHGGGSTIDVTYGKVLPLFARHRTVIALEEQAHGRTTDRDAPVRFDTSAEDVAALLAALHVERADVMGFSNGASVAMRLTLRHPSLVRKLVFASSFTKRSGTFPAFWGFFEHASFEQMPAPLKEAFLKVNPDPEKLRTMHDKDAERMLHFVETSDDEVRSIKAPTLVLLGDRDVPTVEHAVELTHLLPHARLLVLPGGHGDYLGEAATGQAGPRYPELAAGLVLEFLDARD